MKKISGGGGGKSKEKKRKEEEKEKIAIIPVRRPLCTPRKN